MLKAGKIRRQEATKTRQRTGGQENVLKIKKAKEKSSQLLLEMTKKFLLNSFHSGTIENETLLNQL